MTIKATHIKIDNEKFPYVATAYKKKYPKGQEIAYLEMWSKDELAELKDIIEANGFVANLEIDGIEFYHREKSK